MTDSIDTSDREAEEPREPIRLPVREMREEPVPHQAADPLRSALQLALEATPEELPAALNTLRAALASADGGHGVAYTVMGWLVSNDEGDDDFINNPSALKGHHYKGRAPIPLLAAPEAPARTLPRLENCGRYYAEDNKGQWHYINHAGQWCTCPPVTEAPAQANNLTAELQQRCSDWGVYWRAPDAHGVVLTVDQATELLRDALGVEVEVKAPAQAASTQAGQVDAESVVKAAAHELLRTLDHADFPREDIDLDLVRLVCDAALSHPEAPKAAVEPAADGRLHADGYFTWNKGKRPAYIADRGLPCDFYLHPPTTPPAQASDAEDAARWREWLKGNALTVVVPTPTEKNPASKTTIVYAPSPYSGFASAMNAAIDAAMSTTKGAK